MNDKAIHREYFPALDGVRGLAIILVILSHNFGFIPYFHRLGSFGIDLFFVLSGFLITNILLQSRKQRNYFSSFFMRRILRIFPLYYLVVALFFLFGRYSNALAMQYDYYASQWPFVVLHLNNLGQVLFPKPEGLLILNHFWSLSLEEQFYLFWPFFIFLVPSRHLIKGIVSVIIVAILLRLFTWAWFEKGYTYWYIATNIRIDCLAVGGLLATLRHYYPRTCKKWLLRFAIVVWSVHLLLLLTGKLLLASLPHFVIIGYTSFAMLVALFILAALKPSAWLKFLENGALRFVGRISYGLYIFHWPLLVLSSYYLLPVLLTWVPEKRFAIAANGVLSLVAAIVLSVLSYYFYEKRFLRLKGKFQPTDKPA